MCGANVSQEAKQLFGSVLKNTKIRDVIHRIRQDYDRLEKVCDVAEKAAQHGSRDTVVQLSQELERAREAMAQEASDARAERALTDEERQHSKQRYSQLEETCRDIQNRLDQTETNLRGKCLSARVLSCR